MKNFFYTYERSLRSMPQIWHPGFIIHKIIRNEIIHFSSFINEKNSGQVLDFGCGKSPFKKYFRSYQGADIDRINKDPDFLIDNKTNVIVGISDSSIENLISIEVIEHVPDLANFMKEAYRVLKPNGYFLIIAPFVYNYHGSDDYARYSKNYFLHNPIFKDFEVVKINSTPNDFTEFLAFNISHFIGIFPIIRFAYPIFFIINILGLFFSWLCRMSFNLANTISPKFGELYRNSFLLFPLQIAVVLKKKAL